MKCCVQTPGNLTAAGATLSTMSSGHAPSPASSNGSKRRMHGDFGGSHGSLDALASGAERESFFALLRDLGAQSSSGSSCNGNGGSLVPSRSSPERDLDDPVNAKPVGCAPSRLAELLKPNFHSTGRMAVSNTQSEPPASSATGTFTLLAQQQQQSAMLR